MYDRYGEEKVLIQGKNTSVFVPENEIPPMVRNAFIACEDSRFFSHNGIDIKRILGALYKNLKSASFEEGGSTITQQLVKLTHLTQEKKLSRKVNEAVLAIQLENRMSKTEILTHYLNTVYFGSGAYGIESASRVYFGKSIRDVTLSEAAMLAGIIKAPSSYAPDRSYEKAIVRRDYVLKRMYEEGFIEKTDMEEAQKEEIRLIKTKEDEKYAWYRDLVISEATQKLKISADELLSGGYRIYTNLDPVRQAYAEELFEIDALFPKDGIDSVQAQAAFVVLDSRTGGILTVIGARQYEVKRGFNRALSARRQPGSALKPLSVYAAAIDALGMTPSSIVDDTKRTFDGGYEPRNAGDNYNGLVTLREALSRSMNVASVSLIEFTGINRAREYAMRFGLPLSDSDNGLALALGSLTDGVTPTELSEGYAALSNGGNRVKAHAIEKIVNRYGVTVYEFSPPVSRVMTSESAYMLTSMLKTAAESGSARKLKDVSVPVAAKTGTVSIDENRNRDAWTLAYTTEISACIWMGFDETTPDHSLEASESGSFASEFMARFMEKESGEEFVMPKGLSEFSIDKYALKEKKRVWLAPDNAPEALVEKELFRLDQRPTTLSPSFQAPLTPDAPDVLGDGEWDRVSFVIEDENAEYLVMKETDGKKEIVHTVSGAKDDLIEVKIPASDLKSIYTLILRNRIMHENGVTLLSGESQGVLIEGSRNIKSMLNDLLSKFR